ncbi:hypothetical protein A3Q56_06015 [Intoshia linei]|uniref:Uncharacterized protein n=1 Tax=Intoshia linei TaxID=1819745 RepID=A0A177AWN4_9BILA|nr:hypothetical protein A3Q56_06015 [Intoshia linei]
MIIPYKNSQTFKNVFPLPRRIPIKNKLTDSKKDIISMLIKMDNESQEFYMN